MVDLSKLRLRLQTPRGELGAQVRQLERLRIAFEAEAPLRPGDALDFSLATEPEETAEIIRGTLRVLRILDAHPGAPTFFSAELLLLHDGSEGELLALLKAIAGPPVAHFAPFAGSSEQPALVEIDDGSSGPTRPVAEGEMAMASLGTTVTSLSVSARRNRQVRAEDRLAGREAIRAALRRGLPSGAAGRRRTGLGVRGAWLAPTLARTHRLLQRWARAPEPPPPTEADPRVSIDSASTPPLVRVAWSRAERFSADFHAHLSGRGLFVSTEAVLPRHAPVQIELCPPHTAPLRCAGRVEVPMSSGLGLSLHLSEEQLAALRVRAETGPEGPSGRPADTGG